MTHGLARRRALLAAALALPSVFARGEYARADLKPAIERQASRRGVCAVAYATVSARSIAEVGTVTGCDAPESLGAGSVFQAASLSKPVFAYGLLALVDQGKLSLDRPLLDYLPRGYLHRSNPFDIGRAPVTRLVDAPELREVTARMALSHASGLPNWSAERLSFAFRPGTSWLYSGEGYMLLQQVLETLAGEPLDAIMRRVVFEPLGMTRSEFRWRPSFTEQIVVGTSATGEPRQLKFPEPIAAASLYTTAGDFATFLVALLRDASALRAITSSPVVVNSRLGLDWGLGWGVERGEHGPTLWQWGNNPGYRAFAMAVPSSGDAFVLLTNSERGLALAEPMARVVLPGDHPAFQFHMLR